MLTLKIFRNDLYKNVATENKINRESGHCEIKDLNCEPANL